jgi:serine/threonine-protein kinase
MYHRVAVDYEESELPEQRILRSRMGRYTILRRLASGGMASVFLAHVESSEARFQRFVAIKKPHPHLLTNPSIGQMFLNEARLVANLDHENICPITDFGTDDGPYIVMPYLHGEALSELLIHYASTETGAGPVDLMAYVAADVCDGLYYAHNARESGRPLGLVHRDISPHNIFVTFDGSVKILDFGVAKAIGLDGLSVVGQPKGKFAYMSPEQTRGEALDQRSDLFSLGIVLWESLTGRRLFRRDNAAQTMMAISDCYVPPFYEVGAEVPEELSAIVQRALAPRRGDRFPSAREMGRELRRYLAHREAVLCPTEVAAIMREIFPRRAEDRDPLSSVTEPRLALVSAAAVRSASDPSLSGSSSGGLTVRINRPAVEPESSPEIVDVPTARKVPGAPPPPPPRGDSGGNLPGIGEASSPAGRTGTRARPNSEVELPAFARAQPDEALEPERTRRIPHPGPPALTPPVVSTEDLPSVPPPEPWAEEPAEPRAEEPAEVELDTHSSPKPKPRRWQPWFLVAAIAGAAAIYAAVRLA